MAQSGNAPGGLDITYQVGGTFKMIMTWQDQNGNPVDLTNYTADMKIKPSTGSSTVLHESSTTNGEIVLGGTAGTITITTTAATTAAFSWITAVYDLKMTDGSGFVTYLVAGKAMLNPQVTT